MHALEARHSRACLEQTILPSMMQATILASTSCDLEADRADRASECNGQIPSDSMPVARQSKNVDLVLGCTLMNPRGRQARQESTEVIMAGASALPGRNHKPEP